MAQEDGRKNLIKCKEVRKVKHDAKNVQLVKYKQGDLVLIKSETGNKLSTVFEGPYEVIEDCSPNVRVLKNKKETLIHKNRIKMYHK